VFSTLVERYQAPIYRLALRLAANEHRRRRHPSETVLQAFRKRYRRSAATRGFATWLYCIANAALMHRRTGRRHLAESLDACLPRFDDRGHHLRMDVDYSAAARVETSSKGGNSGD